MVSRLAETFGLASVVREQDERGAAQGREADGLGECENAGA